MKPKQIIIWSLILCAVAVLSQQREHLFSKSHPALHRQVRELVLAPNVSELRSQVEGERAIQMFRECPEFLETCSECNNLLAWSHYRAGKSGSAETIQAFTKALGLPPTEARDYGVLATFLDGDGRVEDAATVVERGLRLYPKDYELHVQLYGVWDGLNVDKAGEALDRMVEALPANVDAYILRAKHYESIGAPEALLDFDRAVEIADTLFYKWFAYTQRAHYHFRASRYERAMEDHQRALAVDPQRFFFTHYEIIDLIAQRDGREPALAYLDQLIQLGQYRSALFEKRAELIRLEAP